MPEMAKMAKMARSIFKEVKVVSFGEKSILVILRNGKQYKINVEDPGGVVLEFASKKKEKAQAP